MFEPLFQIMLINTMQGKSRAFKSLTPSYICVEHKTQKFVTASGFCPHRPRLWSQVYRCDYKYKIIQTTLTEAPKYFLKTRVVLMLIIMSSSYLCQYWHHRSPLIKPLKSPWHNSMICGWTSSKFLILLQCFIWVNTLLTKSYDNTILQN